MWVFRDLINLIKYFEVIHEKAKELADREAALNTAQQQLQHELEQKRITEVNTRELITNEAESLKRANELLARLGREREREFWGNWVNTRKSLYPNPYGHNFRLSLGTC
jgi:hypothetical protein